MIAEITILVAHAFAKQPGQVRVLPCWLADRRVISFGLVAYLRDDGDPGWP